MKNPNISKKEQRQTDWFNCRVAGTLKAYEQFIEKYNEGFCVEDIKERIKNLKDPNRSYIDVIMDEITRPYSEKKLFKKHEDDTKKLKVDYRKHK